MKKLEKKRIVIERAWRLGELGNIKSCIQVVDMAKELNILTQIECSSLIYKFKPWKTDDKDFLRVLDSTYERLMKSCGFVNE